MKNAFYHAQAMEAIEQIHGLEQAYYYGIANGYYYADNIRNYLVSWNCLELVRYMDIKQGEAQDEAVRFSYEMSEITDFMELQERYHYFEELGKIYNLLDEFRENYIC